MASKKRCLLFVDTFLKLSLWCVFKQSLPASCLFQDQRKGWAKSRRGPKLHFHIQPKQIWENLLWSQRLNETFLIHLEPIYTFVDQTLWQKTLTECGRILWKNILAERFGRMFWQNVLVEHFGKMLWQNVLAERFGLWSFSDLESVALLSWDYIEWQKCISSCICLCSMLIYLQSRTC